MPRVDLVINYFEAREEQDVELNDFCLEDFGLAELLGVLRSAKRSLDKHAKGIGKNTDRDTLSERHVLYISFPKHTLTISHL